MIVSLMKKVFLITCLTFALANCWASSVSPKEGIIYGNIELEDRWAPELYLSYIPTFDDMHLVANGMIVAKADIDSIGNFLFDIGFLPEEHNLFRIHIVKQGDTPNTLTIGGKDENYVFLLAGRRSVIEMNNELSSPPFRKVSFSKSVDNQMFHEVVSMIITADSIAMGSSSSKRKFIEEQMADKLKAVADTSSNPLVALYAAHNSCFRFSQGNDAAFYRSFKEKWSGQDNSYFKAFNMSNTIETNHSGMWYYLFVAVIVGAAGFLFGRKKERKKPESGIATLSVQERKVFELLKTGATNQQIAEECNIGISTVKSHVSRILSKLNLKSRREVLNLN
ncbi:LuxR family transcriptional regulator [Puteibacter caeruleilacunae]|nr:LuxR family transcriptional regulator [Puteibacter caeruleilacunae]